MINRKFFLKSEKGTKVYDVFRWFRSVFVVLSLVFCLGMTPLLIYLQVTFNNLQVEKYKQIINTGVNEIENIVSGTLNVSQTLASDNNFISLYYVTPNYNAIPIDIAINLKNTYSSLMFPYDLISDSALLLDRSAAVIPNNIFLNGVIEYYPDIFCVNDMSYEEWMEVLSEKKSGFMPVCEVKSFFREYKALIYSTKCRSSIYLYSCIDVEDLNALFFPQPIESGYYLTLCNTTGEILYSNLPEVKGNYKTFSQKADVGGFEVTIYIENEIFFHAMQPLFIFLAIYGCICIVILLICVVLGTRISSYPLISIVNIMENSKHIRISGSSSSSNGSTSKLYQGFNYIMNGILSADGHLEEYVHTIESQQTILQIRFMELAINGLLVKEKDIQEFYSYFPDFPEKYRLIKICLQVISKQASMYSNPIFLIQEFLRGNLTRAYQQQFSDSELLLLVAEEDYEDYKKIINELIKNINQEEPSYYIRGMVSETHQKLENLPIAYRQLRDMEYLEFHNSHTQLSTLADCISAPKTDAIIGLMELQTFYTAINHGNCLLALSLLDRYADNLDCEIDTPRKLAVYEMIRAVLMCIKIEHAVLLDECIPPCFGSNIYPALKDTINRFCEKIKKEKKECEVEENSLAEEILKYIDDHYTDYNLCLAALTTHFECASSTIRKAFKNATNMTITDYIEQKRMNLANELLVQKKKSVNEIAAECGYINANSFYKAYKRVYGRPPTDLHN